MKRIIYTLVVVSLFLISCVDDGTYTPPKYDGDDTTYVVSEPSDGSIATGFSSTTMPVFMTEDVATHRLQMGIQQPTTFYSMDEIKQIDLMFDDSNWESQLLDLSDGDGELNATIRMNGITYPSKVGVRYKGSVSSETNAKRSYYVSIDAVDKDQTLYGYYTLALNSPDNDHSSLRDALYRSCVRRFIPAQQVNFINLHINDVDQGLYVNTEHPNNSFISEWFLSTNGARWRAEPKETGEGTKAGLYGTGYSGLNYLSENATDYEPYYDLKSSPEKTQPLDDLIAVCRLLEKAHPDTLEAAIKSVLDLDRTLWFLACENIFTDEDSYVNKGGTDYYLFWNKKTGWLTPLEYDGKDTFLEEYASWDPFYHADDARFPLLNKLLAAPSIRQRYLAHYRTILMEVYNPAYLHALIDSYALCIDSAIKADPKKSFTHNDFSAAVTTLKSVVTQRAAYLNNHDSIKVTGLTLTDVQWKVGGVKWELPASTDTVKVTVSVGGTGHPLSVFLCAGTGMLGGFKRLQLFDDGQHGDVVAQDGVYTACINPQRSGVRVRFYIEAVRGNAARTRTYLPSGAEHDVFTYVVQ